MMDTQLSTDVVLEQNCTEIVECGDIELPEFTNSESGIVFDQEYSRQLQERIICLRRSIHVLKQQLSEERETWQREIGEKCDDYFGNTMCQGMGYYGDYDCVLHSHYETRQNIQKQLALANYKRRLLEVENMCTLELLRVKQSVQILQPLQIIANEWKLEKFDKDAGDYTKDNVEKEETIKEVNEGTPSEENVEVGAGESPLIGASETSDTSPVIKNVEECCSVDCKIISDTHGSITDLAKL